MSSLNINIYLCCNNNKPYSIVLRIIMHFYYILNSGDIKSFVKQMKISQYEKHIIIILKKKVYLKSEIKTVSGLFYKSVIRVVRYLLKYFLSHRKYIRVFRTIIIKTLK